jgi:hypothetical protein
MLQFIERLRYKLFLLHQLFFLWFGSCHSFGVAWGLWVVCCLSRSQVGLSKLRIKKLIGLPTWVFSKKNREQVLAAGGYTSFVFWLD